MGVVCAALECSAGCVLSLCAAVLVVGAQGTVRHAAMHTTPSQLQWKLLLLYHKGRVLLGGTQLL